MPKYLTHDNGGISFFVDIKNKTLDVYTLSNNSFNVSTHTLIKDPAKYFTYHVLHIAKYKKIFKIEQPTWAIKRGMSFQNGNSVLIQTSNTSYIWIGWKIEQFTISDPIIRFFSPIGNNDVPYPYAIGSKNTYLMLENIYIPNQDLYSTDKPDEKIVQEVDPYARYYLASKKTNKFYKDNYTYNKKILIDRL